MAHSTHNTIMVFDGSPFHPSWWLSLRDSLTYVEMLRIRQTSWLMHWGAISYFEEVAFLIHYPTIYNNLLETLEKRPPEILIQHLGAGGNEDAMWMKLRQYLDKDKWPALFITNRGDADVILKMRKWKLDWAADELKEAWEDWDVPGTVDLLELDY